MAEINLSQSEADALIAMEKIRVNEQIIYYPSIGERISVPLMSRNKRENFILDISRGKIDLLKGTYQDRARQVVILVRLDFGGQPHRNPDGKEITSPHLHIFKEGYGDKWAETIPQDRFPNTTNLLQLIGDFMSYCNIKEPPFIEGRLF